MQTKQGWLRCGWLVAGFLALCGAGRVQAQYTNLHEFAGGAGDGAVPLGSLTLSGTTLYGMAEAGGVSNNGVVFKIRTDLGNSLEEVGLWGKIGQATYEITEKKDQKDAVDRTMAFVRLKEKEKAVVFCKRGIWALSYFPQLANEFTPFLHDMANSKNEEIANFVKKTFPKL